MTSLLVFPAVLLALLAPTLTAPSAMARDGRGATALFAAADINNDGRVSRVEFDAAREGVFARIDANGDGRLTLSELRDLRPEGGSRRPPGREALGNLRAIDLNNDRAVSLGEFRAASTGRFLQADANRDGALGRDEAAQYVRSLGLGG
jgi:hypothetical protein